MDGLTVGIPAYNEERTIVQTVHSVVTQPLDGSLEVLVCANGCTDDTVGNVTSYMQGIPDTVEMHVWEAPKGKPNAWNEIRERATYDTIAFADGDVHVEEGALQQLKDALETKDIIGAGAMVVPDTQGLDPITRLYTGEPNPDQHCLIGRLYAVNNIALEGRLRETGHEHMPEDIIHEDKWVTMVIGEGNWDTVPEARVRYVPHAWYEAPKIRYRLNAANEQLEKRYPELYREQFGSWGGGTQQRDPPVETLRRKIHTFRDLSPQARWNVAARKVVGAGVSVATRAMQWYHRRTGAKGLDHWKTAKSSKRPVVSAMSD